MRIARIILTSALALALVAVTGVAYAIPQQAPPSQQAPQTQTASGKITAVNGSSSFTLDVQRAMAAGTMESMTFSIDKNTQIEGKLKVGSTATVEYRSQGDQNVAVHVVVSE